MLVGGTSPVSDRLSPDGSYVKLTYTLEKRTFCGGWLARCQFYSCKVPWACGGLGGLPKTVTWWEIEMAVAVVRQ